MPSEYLTRLKHLHEHYVACKELAAKGDWEELIRRSEEGKRLFVALQAASDTPALSEHAEAKLQLTETLEADKAIRFLATAWLTDAEPLLRTLNKRP